MGQKNTRETLIEELDSLRDTLIDGPEIQHDILRDADVEQRPPHEIAAVNLEIPILTDRYDGALPESASQGLSTPETTAPEPSTSEPSNSEPSTSEPAPNQTHLFDNTDFEHSES
ncbi:MAG TPA: hypothetical protein ENI05_15940 [Porticoccus sp.]|nr:hypothetical protein [Porticoccus sp.]